MHRIKTGLFILGLSFVLSGCVIVDAENSCRARGGTWSEYDAIGQKIWPGRCVGGQVSQKDQCDRIRDEIAKGSFQKLPSYCDKKATSADKPKTPNVSFLPTADVAAFPKSPAQPTEGERYLMDTVSPFLCEVVKAYKPEEKLKSMGAVTEVDTGSSYKEYDYDAEGFEGTLLQFYDFQRKYVERSSIHLRKKNLRTESWPFTQDELTSWLSSRGFKVLLQAEDQARGQWIKGVAAYDDYNRGSYTDTLSYGIVFSGNHQLKVTPTAENPAGKVESGMSLSWEEFSRPDDLICNK